MKLSMWIIKERLEQYHPIFDIKDGTARITGLRFLSQEGNFDPDSSYLYLSQSVDHVITLSNGGDTITLESVDHNDIFNTLIGIFDFFQRWHLALMEAAANHSLQELIDLGTSALNHPITLTDMAGNVLALSSSFLSDEINDFWANSQKTGRLSTELFALPLTNLNHENASWSNIPQIFLTPDKQKIIGMYLSIDGKQIAALGMREYKKPITLGDLCITKVLSNALITALSDQVHSIPARSSSDIVADILNGTDVARELTETISRKCSGPWKMILIYNPNRKEIIYKHALIQRFQGLHIPCIPLEYEDYVLVLASDSTTDALLNSILDNREKKYFQICYSLPFDDLHRLPVRYQQMRYMMMQIGEKTGLYHTENYAFSYLLSLFQAQNQTQGLEHPALSKLREYDAKNHGDFYETLYQYLIHERSLLQGAQAMGIHKNSFLYRMQRIRSLVDIDLDDPMTRGYLLLSYFIEKNPS